jgi:hypothetical protein
LAIVQPSLSGPGKGVGLAIHLRPIFDIEGSGDYPANVGLANEKEKKGKEEGAWKQKERSLEI